MQFREPVNLPFDVINQNTWMYYIEVFFPVFSELWDDPEIRSKQCNYYYNFHSDFLSFVQRFSGIYKDPAYGQEWVTPDLLIPWMIANREFIARHVEYKLL